MVAKHSETCVIHMMTPEQQGGQWFPSGHLRGSIAKWHNIPII